MRKWMICTLALFFALTSHAQSDSVRIAQLQAQVDGISRMLVERDSTEWAKARALLFDGALRATWVNDRAETQFKKLRDVKFIAGLLNVNNVDTRQLMGQFEDMFRDAVTRKLDALNIRDTARRGGIFRLIKGISASPVLTPILHSNPITSFITSGLGLIAGIAQPEVDVRRTSLNVVRDVTLGVKQLFSWEELTAIQRRIEPYVQFYDSLSLMNTQFTARMLHLQREAVEVWNSVRPGSQYMKDKLGISASTEPNAVAERLTRVLGGPAATGIGRYHQFLSRSEVQEALHHALAINEGNERINRLVAAYDGAMESFRQQYLGVINRFREKLPLLRTRLDQQYASLTEEGPQMNALMSQPRNMSAAEKRAMELRGMDYWSNRETEEQVMKTIFQ